ncbi:FxLYD domain-containing protein [Streptomyces sparsus]
MRTPIVTAVLAAACLTLTACGDAVNDKSRGYNADNLTPAETRFMDVVYDISPKKNELRESTAGEVAQGAKALRLFCATGESERAQAVDEDGKMSAADQAKLNKAFADHLCTDEDASEADAGAEQSEAPGTVHDKDVKITEQGAESEYDINTYRVTFTVTNSGKEAANYWIEFEAYDQDGDFLGGTGSSVERLGPGKTKNAEIDFYDETVENGELADIDTVKVKKVEYCDGGDDDPIMCQI